MTYPRWLPQSLMAWTLYGSAVALLVFSCTVAILTLRYGPETCKAVKDTAVNGKLIPADVHSLAVGLTGDSKAIATDIHRDVIVAGAAEAETEKTMRLIRAEAPAFIQQGHQELSDIQNLTVDSDKTLREAQAIPPRVTTALDEIPALMESARNATESANRLIASPKIDTLLGNVDSVTANTARATNDLANKEHDLFYPPPCTGKLCPIKKLWRIGKAVIGLAEPAYYGVGIARGQ